MSSYHPPRSPWHFLVLFFFIPTAWNLGPYLSHSAAHFPWLGHLLSLHDKRTEREKKHQGFSPPWDNGPSDHRGRVSSLWAFRGLQVTMIGTWEKGEMKKNYFPHCEYWQIPFPLLKPELEGFLKLLLFIPMPTSRLHMASHLSWEHQGRRYSKLFAGLVILQIPCYFSESSN